MKNFRITCFFLAIAFLTLSCDTSNPDNEIIDDYNLVAVSDRGEIFEIGNNTGQIVNVGLIARENEASSTITNNLISTDKSIFSMEYTYTPTPTNNLLKYDRQTGSSQIIPLTLPSTIEGYDRCIVALAVDDNNLIGVLNEDLLRDHAPNHIINIDLQNYSVTDLGISFNESYISSLLKIGSILYISTLREGFLIVDLEQKTIEKLDAVNGGKLALRNNSELAIMLEGQGGYKPGLFNLNTKHISDHSNGESFGIVADFGNAIYTDQTYYNLITDRDLNLHLGILKTDFKTNTNSIIPVKSTTVDNNLIIVDITDQPSI